jgi:pimeloyl-ACP methyl ester carboxylesterase
MTFLLEQTADEILGHAEGIIEPLARQDAQKQHLRIEAALGAAGVTEIPKEGIPLVGYSQGAALAEQMVQRWPTRYARLVLIGAPTDPAPNNLARARSVVTMSCDRDVPSRMKLAAAGATKVGTPATYLEMPGCTHGNITDGERIFDATFDFLRTNERALDAKAAPVRIVGSPTDA